MPEPTVHLLNDPRPTGYRALCKAVSPVFWTREAQAVTCPKCISLMDLQPA